MNRSLPLGLALAGIAAALIFVLAPPLGRHFAATMTAHMLLVAVVAPLLVTGLPASGWRPGVLIGVVAELAVVWGWHLPELHAAQSASPVVAMLAQATFLAAGWLVWVGALSARDPLVGAMGLFLTSMHMTLLGALLILSPRDLYGHACTGCGGLADQQIGGMIMIGVGTPVYLVAALWLAHRALTPETKGPLS